MLGYCMKCKAKQEMEDVIESKTLKGLRIAKGTCPVCKTKMAKILGK